MKDSRNSALTSSVGPLRGLHSPLYSFTTTACKKKKKKKREKPGSVVQTLPSGDEGGGVGGGGGGGSHACKCINLIVMTMEDTSVALF